MTTTRAAASAATPRLGPTDIVVGAYPLDNGFWFAPHEHPQPQVLWASRGVLTVAVADRQWVLPPTRALWMPVRVTHRTGVTRKALLHGIYLRDGRGSPNWQRPTVVAVGPLLAELVHHLSSDRTATRSRRHAEALVLDLLEPLPAAPLQLRMPTDPRAAKVAAALHADPSDRRGLDALAQFAETSPRTLSRLFVAETGTNFDRWRTHLRLRAALPLLAEGAPVSAVAHAVGYATASAFLSAFRRTVGMPPRAYLSERPAG